MIRVPGILRRGAQHLVICSDRNYVSCGLHTWILVKSSLASPFFRKQYLHTGKDIYGHNDVCFICSVSWERRR